MHDSAERLRKDLAELFPEGFNFKQLWWIVKIAKGTRMYCRTNVEFNNYMNSIFSGKAKFEQVTKSGKDEKSYLGLQITMRTTDGSELTEVDNGWEEK